MAMIKEKLKGHKPIIAAAPERGNVINLMDALKASLGQAKPPAEQAEARRNGRQPAEEAAAEGRAPPAAAAERRPRARRDRGATARPSASSARSRPSRAGWRRARSRRAGGALRRGVSRAHHPRRVRPHAARPLEPDAAIEARVAAARAAGRKLLSENGFLRLLGLAERGAEQRHLSRQSLLEQSGLSGDDARPARAVRRLRARRRALLVPRPDPRPQVRGLIAGGRRLGRDRALGAPLRAGRLADRAVAARSARPRRSTLGDGDAAERARRPAAASTSARPTSDAEELFAAAEAAEAGRAARRGGGALRALPRARSRRRGRRLQPRQLPARRRRPTRRRTTTCAPIKLDPRLRRGLVQPRRPRRAGGRRTAARRHLARAIALDPATPTRSTTSPRSSSTPGDLAEARRWWSATSSSTATVGMGAHRDAAASRFVDLTPRRAAG